MPAEKLALYFNYLLDERELPPLDAPPPIDPIDPDDRVGVMLEPLLELVERVGVEVGLTLLLVVVDLAGLADLLIEVGLADLP